MEFEPVDISNEEEAKVKLVLPWLRSIGFNDEGISLEGSFYIRLGRNSVRVGQDEGSTSRNGVGGRFDILVKYAGRNLMVVETKEIGRELNDDDRDQAISYARLVDNICPYAVVTNGYNAIIYDTVTREEIVDKVVLRGANVPFQLGMHEENELRYEALIHFIGLSEDNIRTFSKLQVNKRMEQLKGTESDRAYRKYIPGLFVARAHTDEMFREFCCQIDKTAFCLVGPSGTGKTNWCCNTCESLVGAGSGVMPLFYSGMDLGDSLLATLSNDFNLVFSAERTPIQLLRSISGVLRPKDLRLYIFLDAVDEWTHRDPIRDIDDFLNQIEVTEAPIRLIITCKSSMWQTLAIRNGSPSRLITRMYSPVVQGIPEATEDILQRLLPNPAFQGHFDDDEVQLAIQEYARVFTVKGLQNPVLHGIVRDPFMLRLVCEVYEGQHGDVPASVTEDRLFRAYLDKKQLQVGTSVPNIRIILYKVGRAMLQRASSSLVLMDAPEVSQQEISILIAHGILTQTEDGFGRPYVAFYFSPLRDYIVAIDVVRLDSLSMDIFRENVHELLETDIGQSSLMWYYRVSRGQQRQYLDSIREVKAMAFLSHYENLISMYAPSLKAQFDPYTGAEIGLQVVFNDMAVHHFAFFELSDGEKRVKVLPHEISLGNGVQRAHFMSHNFMNMDPRDSAMNMFKTQFLKLVEGGFLNERGILALTLEKLYGLAYVLKNELGMNVSPAFMAEEINLTTLKNAIRRFQANILASIEMGQGRISYEDMDRFAEQLLSSQETLDVPRIVMNRTRGPVPFDEMYNCIEELELDGITAVRPVIPSGDIRRSSGPIEDFYSADRKKDVVRVFYSELIRSLRRIINLNLHQFGDAILPKYVNLTIEFRADDQRWPIVETWSLNDDSDQDIVSFHFDATTETADCDVIFQAKREFSYIFNSVSYLKYPCPAIANDSPIRSTIYRLLHSKLKNFTFHDSSNDNFPGGD